MKEMKNALKIFAHLGGGMDCVTASYAGVAGSSPTGKEQKFVPFSFIRNPPFHYLKGTDVIGRIQCDYYH